MLYYVQENNINSITINEISRPIFNIILYYNTCTSGMRYQDFIEHFKKKEKTKIKYLEKLRIFIKC